MRSSLFLSLLLAAVASAHIVISYPGWRGNNLKTNATFPYGMQWMYPCGGINVTTNRTYWPTVGGALAFQPGWFRGHETAMLYVNIGFGEDGPDGGPANMTHPIVPGFQLLGPTNNPYPGTVCLPQVPLPKNMTVKEGDNATIQIVELAVHGAALYSCVDITFVEPGSDKLQEVNEDNCSNSTDFGFAEVYTITTEPGTGVHAKSTSSIASSLRDVSWAGLLSLAAAGLWAVL